MLVGGKAHGAGVAVVQRSLVHLRGVMTHAQAQVEMVVVVVLLCGLSMIVVAAGVVVVVLLRGLSLRVLLVLHASILKPDFHLNKHTHTESQTILSLPCPSPLT